MRILASKIISAMWEMGRPCSDARYVNVYRAAIKAGLDDGQALALANLAYDAANGHEWKLGETADVLRYRTQLAEATKHPRGKCAEDLAAAREGRASRWGTPEYHRAS